MTLINKNALIEATRELLRVVLLAIIPVVSMGLENGNLDVRVISTVAGLAALRWLDKYLHALGKEQNNDRLVKGLTRF